MTDTYKEDKTKAANAPPKSGFWATTSDDPRIIINWELVAKMANTTLENYHKLLDKSSPSFLITKVGAQKIYNSLDSDAHARWGPVTWAAVHSSVLLLRHFNETVWQKIGGSK